LDLPRHLTRRARAPVINRRGDGQGCCRCRLEWCVGVFVGRV